MVAGEVAFGDETVDQREQEAEVVDLAPVDGEVADEAAIVQSKLRESG